MSSRSPRSHDDLSKFYCGFLSGLVQAGLFNPWDRALYLSVKFERRFLDRSNFVEPWKGVMQTLIQRAISAGFYFPLEDIFRRVVTKDIPSHLSKQYEMSSSMMNLSAGMLAGCVNGVIMNPVTRVKYHYWGLQECGKENFMSTAFHMLKTGGVRPFFLGSLATISRDVVFGGVFSAVRNANHKPEKVDLLVNIIAGCLGTIFSSPLNYIRNVHYATPPSEPRIPGPKILSNLWSDAMKQGGLYERMSYLQHRLRIGWGTARVGCGMAIGAGVYERCKRGTLD